ncbi:MAG TPA: hypothetical protein VFR03_04400 [Thermoanaerobaculia bacterium]|nr:hypothetical protein [Thermoanaerobaculia bacterium]
MKIRLRSALALSLLTLSGPVLAHTRPSPLAPGEYRNWGGSIDKLEIVSPFKLSRYHQILVAPFDTSSVSLPDARDASYKPVQEILSQAAAPFVFGLKEVLLKVPAQVAGPGVSPGPGTLVVHCKLTALSPGKQVPRYARNDPARPSATIEGEVVDGGTGKTLLRFRQERHFGSGIMKGGRHDAAEVHVNLKPIPASEEPKRDMGLNIRLIGQDVGDILRTF